MPESRRLISAHSVVRGLAAIALAAALAACSDLPLGLGGTDGPDVPHPYPAGCGAFQLSPRRCTAIVDALAAQAGLARAQIADVTLLGDKPCLSDTGAPVLCMRTMSFIVRVRFRTVDGGTVDQSQFCGVGGQYTILCSDNPEIAIVSPIDGYMDVPCTDVVPDSCATLFPNPDPAAAAAAVPLTIDALAVPIDRLGAFEIHLGNGSLANGILKEANLTVADLHPTDFLLSAGGLHLEITSLAADGKPFDNYYTHGRRDGVEPFSATLRFEVLWFEPGAVLTIDQIHVS